MNIDKILQLADHIEHQPEAHYRYDRVDPTEGYNQSMWHHSCGTPACIAGHAIALEYKVTNIEEFMLEKQQAFFAANPDSNDYPSFSGMGREILGLTFEQAGKLFHAGMAATREDAVKTLRHLAETGKVDWYI